MSARIKQFRPKMKVKELKPKIKIVVTGEHEEISSLEREITPESGEEFSGSDERRANVLSNNGTQAQFQQPAQANINVTRDDNENTRVTNYQVEQAINRERRPYQLASPAGGIGRTNDTQMSQVSPFRPGLDNAPVTPGAFKDDLREREYQHMQEEKTKRRMPWEV